MNGTGTVLLLLFHFPFVFPTGESALLADGVPSVEFWKWTNGIFSVIGLALALVGLFLQDPPRRVSAWFTRNVRPPGA
jgi:hypothetical protein